MHNKAISKRMHCCIESILYTLYIMHYAVYSIFTYLKKMIGNVT